MFLPFIQKRKKNNNGIKPLPNLGKTLMNMFQNVKSHVNYKIHSLLKKE